MQLTDCCIEIIAFGFRFDPLEEAPHNSCRQLNRNGISDKVKGRAAVSDMLQHFHHEELSGF
jgi:hypothetical protein